MLRSITAAALMGAGLIAACSPAFNWREDVFQAVIYADRLRPEMADPFFAGLTFE